MKIDSTITLHVSELTREQRTKLLAMLTFTDNDDIEVQAYDYFPDTGKLRVPRGVWSSLPSNLEVIDARVKPLMPKLHYAKQLNAPGYDGQAEAVQAMVLHQQGQVIAPPGRGKTEIALAFVAAAKTTALVVVHTKELFDQWVSRIADSVPGCIPGKIQGKTCQVSHITVAMAQTLRSYIRGGRKWWSQFGCLIVDEAHHAAAETWAWLCNMCPAFYRFGITASEKRSDGRQPLVKFNIGPVIYKLAFRSQVPMVVRPTKSGFKTRYNGTQYTQIMRELVNDDDRNMVIAEIIADEVRRGNSVLVLSRWIKHLKLIHAAMMVKYPYNGSTVKIVTGQLPRAQRNKLVQQLRDGEIRCILGTQLFEEGVDIPRLNRIILAFPGTEITALQKVGRGARQFEGKTETIVYDILDDLVRVLAKQYLRRQAWYKSVGIKVDKSKGKGEVYGGKQTQEPSSRKRLVHGALRVARSRRAG